MEIFEKPVWTPEKKTKTIPKIEKIEKSKFAPEQKTFSEDKKENNNPDNKAEEEKLRRDKNDTEDKGRLIDLKI